MTTYMVILECGTTGTIDSDTLDGQSASDFIGEMVTIKCHDENGMTMEIEGVLAEVL